VPRTAPQARITETFPSDVIPGLMRLREQEKTVTWDSARKRPRPNRRLLLLLLALPFLLGSLGAAPNAPSAHADELSQARARQSQLKKQIAAQQREVLRLSSLQRDLTKDIAATKTELRSINADLVTVKKRITRMKKKIEEVKAVYASLVKRGEELDTQLTQLQAEEAEKAAKLADRKDELALRIRSAYDTDRTSLLETFLSGGSFTDILAEASYMIDVGEQDKALAEQIERDQEALAAVHQTVEETRLVTEELRVETAAQKKKLDKALADLKREQKKLRKLEKAAQRELARQKAAFERLAKNKKGLKRAIARAHASQSALAKRIDRIIASQKARGNIPSKFNGSFRWPLVGRISGEFGCSSYPGYGPGYGCTHFHNGIDIVGPYGAPIRAAGKGTVVYVGWNYADGADPAWIVVIAHSSALQTWYAHMTPTAPVSVGQHVSAGQVIGYEGLTGNTTGAHLHWMVELNGTWQNPRLFL
jgi:murein DD-endopeptidase MepM/ murein hydrolase activator NlpD